jgi:hypothetical protein
MAATSPGHPAGWLADPTGRHQLRYWDGAVWTDHVADHGVAGYDPVYAFGPSGPQVAAAVRRRRSKRPLVIALVAVGAIVALVAAAAIFLSVIRGDGSGTFARELPDRGDTLVHPIEVPEDSVVLLRVSSEDDAFDPVIGLDASPETVDEYVDFFGGEAALPADEFPGTVPDDRQLMAVADGFPGGEDEVTYIGTPFAGDFDVLVTGAGDSNGEFELEVVFEPFDGPDDPDAYNEELAAQDFVQNFEPPRSPIDDILDDFIDEGSDGD